MKKKPIVTIKVYGLKSDFKIGDRIKYFHEEEMINSDMLIRELTFNFAEETTTISGDANYRIFSNASMKILNDDKINTIALTEGEVFSSSYPADNVLDDFPGHPFMANSAETTIQATILTGIKSLFLSNLIG